MELHSDIFLQHYHSPHSLCLPWETGKSPWFLFPGLYVNLLSFWLEVRRRLLFSSLQLLNETSSLSSLIHTKTQSKESAEMASFCCLSDGNHAKPQSLAWSLPETINRAAQLKLIPVLLKPQPKVVRQSLNPGGCFGVCWPSMVAYKKLKILLSYLLGLGFHCWSSIFLYLQPNVLKLVSRCLLALLQVR